jgi:uncharacterized membrane protein YhaH (DUF805 family)
MPPPRSAGGAWTCFLGAFRKYAVFSGRAGLLECLSVLFISSLLISIFNAIDVWLAQNAEFYLYADGSMWLGLFKTAYSLASFLPLLGVLVRRMHDIDKSGWYVLIPVYGWIILPLYEGTKGPNQYGPDPKETNG